MPVVYWYKVKNPTTGHMEEGSKKATEETIESLGGIQQMQDQAPCSRASLGGQGLSK